MKRSAKNSRKSSELIEEVLQELDIEEVPHAKCMIKGRATSPITYCTSRCMMPCKNFTMFRFITLNCVEESCTPDNPCFVCLDEIEDMKTLIAALHILDVRVGYSPHNRVVGYNAAANKMKKRMNYE